MKWDAHRLQILLAVAVLAAVSLTGCDSSTSVSETQTSSPTPSHDPDVVVGGIGDKQVGPPAPLPSGVDPNKTDLPTGSATNG